MKIDHWLKCLIYSHIIHTIIYFLYQLLVKAKLKIHPSQFQIIHQKKNFFSISKKFLLHYFIPIIFFLPSPPHLFIQQHSSINKICVAMYKIFIYITRYIYYSNGWMDGLNVWIAPVIGCYEQCDLRET